QHVRVATDGLAAIAIIGEELGFVADANLPHLDPSLIFLGQILYQFAEVNAFLCQEIKDDPLAAKHVFDINELHLQLTLIDESAAVVQRVLLARTNPFELGAVVAVHPALDLPSSRLADQANRPWSRLAQYFTDFKASVRADHNLTAAGVRLLPGGLELSHET